MRRRAVQTRAFTLIEMLAVIVLLALAAAMIVPRLGAQRGREMELATERVADLLMMFAQREQLARRPVGIWHDAQRNEILLMILEEDPADPGAPADWRRDPAVRPVALPPSIEPDGVMAVVDGQIIDIQQWPITSEPGKPRPRIEVTLMDQTGRETTTVLPAHAISPIRAGDELLTAERYPIDLDSAGRTQEDW